MSGEESWFSVQTHVNVLPDWKYDEILETQSVQVCLGEELEEESRSVNLFDAVKILESSVPKKKGKTGKCLLDAAGFAGGLVWAMDWCPRRSKPKISKEILKGRDILAVSTHPKTHRRNTVGSVFTGPGVIQLWSFIQCPSVDKGERNVRMVMGIVHEGVLAWDVQWCPEPSVFSQNTSGEDSADLLGVLAVALGNGTVEVLCVPKPETVRQEMAPDLDTDEPLFVKIKPSVKITQQDLCGSVASCIDWLPTSPHDVLLIGCWDGFVTAMRLPQGRRTEPKQLLYHQCEMLAIRRALWFRPRDRGQDADNTYRTMFVTAGHAGRITIWDMKDIYNPIFTKTLTRSWVTDVLVCSRPLAIYVVLEDATLRQIPLEVRCFASGIESTVEYRFGGLNQGAIWSLACCDSSMLAAYGGEDGEIGVFEMANLADARYRKPHVCVGSMKAEGEVLRLLTASEVGLIGGMFTGGSHYKARRGMQLQVAGQQTCHSMSEFQTIHSVKFSPNGGATTWLAAGTSAGLIRVMRISQ